MSYSTKASYNMARGIRASSPTVQQLDPNMWVARGALPFPQGLTVIYNLFAGKHLAEAVSHPYFIEKEYWPEQPSTQFHLTEEIQSMMLVMKGVTKMDDQSTHLDNTMTILRNPKKETDFVLYNPIDVSNVTLKYIRDIVGKGEVTRIIVPSRQTWQSAGEWSLQYPNAQIVCAGNVPFRFTKQGTELAQAELAKWKLESKWDERQKKLKEQEEAEAAEAAKREADRLQGKRIRPNMTRPESRTDVNTKTNARDGMFSTQFKRLAPPTATGFGVELPQQSPFAFQETSGKGRDTHMKRQAKTREQNALDMNRLGRSDLFTNEAFADTLDPNVRRKVVTTAVPTRKMHVPAAPGLSGSKATTIGGDADVNGDCTEEGDSELAKEPLPEDVAPNVSILDPYQGLDIWGDGSAQLLHISGDKVTNEFVLYYAPSKMLACTDLYHGPYTDFDPMNTWLCRVWFKLQRGGNYKSPTILPSYRRIHIEENGDMLEMRSCVDDLTRAFKIEQLCPAHGSVPFLEDPTTQLRTMYELEPLR